MPADLRWRRNVVLPRQRRKVEAPEPLVIVKRDDAKSRGEAGNGGLQRGTIHAAKGDNGGGLHLRHFNESAGDEGLRDVDSPVEMPFREQTGAKTWRDEITYELVLRVDDVRANGSEHERTFTDGRQLAGLPEIERDRDDLGVVKIGRAHV